MTRRSDIDVPGYALAPVNCGVPWAVRLGSLAIRPYNVVGSGTRRTFIAAGPTEKVLQQTIQPLNLLQFNLAEMDDTYLLPRWPTESERYYRVYVLRGALTNLPI